jgi:aminoglycoside phosphotransferase
MSYLESDRFVIPRADRSARKYFGDRLYVPHGITERIRRAVGRPQTRAATEAALAGAQPLLDLLPRDLPRRRIVLRDYETSDRERIVAFLFASGERVPHAVAKAQRSLASPSLRKEADALAHLHRVLPSDLRKTIPEVTHFESSSDGELLVTTALAGCSAYVEIQGSLLPARHVDRHFDAAAQWLATFHEATAASDSDRTAGSWSAASHGDFWARNLLLERSGGTGVVDWEDFSLLADPFCDLFHFPLTYGLAYPWQNYRRLPAEAAFSMTFLEPNRISRAVLRYLRIYAERTALPRPLLREAFGEYLRTRGSMVASSNPVRKIESLPWHRLSEQFHRTSGFVFSG